MKTARGEEVAAVIALFIVRKLNGEPPPPEPQATPVLRSAPPVRKLAHPAACDVTAKLVLVAFVDVELTEKRLVMRPLREKRLVEVALVVVEFTENRLVMRPLRENRLVEVALVEVALVMSALVMEVSPVLSMEKKVEVAELAVVEAT